MAEQTVRGFIGLLAEAAAQFPDGLDLAIEMAICDGTTMQFINDVDVDSWAEVRADGRPSAHGRRYVLIRGHWHPGESPGRRHSAVTAGVDEELRKLGDG